MKLSEAIAAMEAGKKVCHVTKAGYLEMWDGYLYARISGDTREKVPMVRLLGELEGWELYEEPGHDFAWALEQLKAGKNVRRKLWLLGEFISPDGPRPGRGNYALISDMIATDWELA